VEPQVGFCTTPDGAHIAYAILGQGSAMVLPPAHFASITPYQTVSEVRHVFDSLARYHTVVYYDQRGAGLSDRNRTVFTLESELSDLETVIDHLKLDKMTLFGAAIAGPISIAYAAKYTERVTHLILYDTYAYYGKFVSEEFKAALVSLLREPDNWLGRRAQISLGVAQGGMDYLDLIAGLIKEVTTSEIAGRITEMAYTLDITQLCPLIKAPTLVMHRKGDLLIDFKAGLELASLIPKARFVPLEGDLHYYILGDTESVLNNIFEFLGDPVPEQSNNDTGKVESLSHLVEPKPEQKKLDWLRVDNPLVYIIVTIVASVIAGAILTLFKC